PLPILGDKDWLRRLLSESRNLIGFVPQIGDRLDNRHTQDLIIILSIAKFSLYCCRLPGSTPPATTLLTAGCLRCSASYDRVRSVRRGREFFHPRHPRQNCADV